MFKKGIFSLETDDGTPDGSSIIYKILGIFYYREWVQKKKKKKARKTVQDFLLGRGFV